MGTRSHPRALPLPPPLNPCRGVPFLANSPFHLSAPLDGAAAPRSLPRLILFPPPSAPDTLCNELDQERKARYAIQQKLKGTEAGGGAQPSNAGSESRPPPPPSVGSGLTAVSLCRGPRRAAPLLLQDADPAALHGELLLQTAAAAPVTPPGPSPFPPRSHAPRGAPQPRAEPTQSHFHEEPRVHKGTRSSALSDWQ